ncbi:MAG TPA: helix-hairpin-helix domain-containing protein [Allocoleopsis sp.]
MKKSSLFAQTPNWIWFSFIPNFGGLAILYAGIKTKTPLWMGVGVGLTIASFSLYSTHLIFPIWVAQIVISFSLKKQFIIKTADDKDLIPTDANTAKLIAGIKGKIDINNCSKNDLVNLLGLPIVYANDIESLKLEGYIFTHIEELEELAGVPQNHLQRIEPMIVFSYDINKEVHCIWKRVNILSQEDLILLGLEPRVAQQIFTERQLRGEYQSVLDIKKRTGLPFYMYKKIV